MWFPGVCGQRFYCEYWIMQAVIYVQQQNNQDFLYTNIFLLSHKDNNSCISLKRYLSLAYMCSYLLHPCYEELLGMCYTLCLFCYYIIKKKCFLCWPSKTITKTGFCNHTSYAASHLSCVTLNSFWIPPVSYVAILYFSVVGVSSSLSAGAV